MNLFSKLKSIMFKNNNKSDLIIIGNNICINTTVTVLCNYNYKKKHVNCIHYFEPNVCYIESECILYCCNFKYLHKINTLCLNMTYVSCFNDDCKINNHSLREIYLVFNNNKFPPQYFLDIHGCTKLNYLFIYGLNKNITFANNVNFSKFIEKLRNHPNIKKIKIELMDTDVEYIFKFMNLHFPNITFL